MICAFVRKTKMGRCFRAVAFSMALLMLSILLASCSNKQQKRVVNVYNWGAYIDKDLLSAFEEETGIHVVYSNYATNEDLYVKIKNGGSNYDVIVPSDYMIERMSREGLLQAIQWNLVPNISAVDASYLHRPFDPEQRYSAPCFWGTLGILYNKDLVQEPVDSWNILWDPQYSRQIIMMDSSRDSIGLALRLAGHSLNSKDPSALEIAAQHLQAQYPLVYAYLGDQTKDIMVNGEAALAVAYSGDALDAMFSNERLAYAVPKEGSNIWFDGWAIPARAQNVEEAHAFINFMLAPERAAQNADYVGYSLPSSSARALQDPDYRDSEVAYPNMSAMPELEVFRDPGAFVRQYDELWQRVKIG